MQATGTKFLTFFGYAHGDPEALNPKPEVLGKILEQSQPGFEGLGFREAKIRLHAIE